MNLPLRDRLLGDPSRLDPRGLLRGVRHGSEALVVGCLRAIGARGGADLVEPIAGFLGDDRAAVRRAAVDAVGAVAERSPGVRSAVLRALDTGADRTEEGALALATARVRAGAASAEARAELSRYERRTLLTPAGPRTPAEVTGAGSLVERFDLATAAPRDAARAGGAPTDRDALLARAALRHPDDLDALFAFRFSAGRREEHAVWIALGWHGDPRAAAPLRDALRATDVDPGRGFAQRRLAATALGRIGLRSVAPWLRRALEDEAHDFEGRPGAGLGIQYPVRTNLLWALGEVGDPADVPLLVSYLADTRGSALGGFYLPAMDALTRLGRVALGPVREAARTAPEPTCAHAVGVLLALGEPAEPWRADPRASIRAVAGGER